MPTPTGTTTWSNIQSLIIMCISTKICSREQGMNKPQGPKYLWLLGGWYWKSLKTKMNMTYSYMQPMLNERKGYQRKFWPRSGILAKIEQGARYNPPQNWITKTLPQVYIENLVQMIACCDTRGLIPTSSLILSGSQILLKVSMTLLICNYLYLTKALLEYMKWDLINKYSKRLKCFAKRS